MWLRPFRLDDAASVIMLNTKLVSPVYFIFSMSSYRAKIHTHSRSCVYKYQTHPQSQSQTHRTPKSEYHRRTQPNKTENLQHAGKSPSKFREWIAIRYTGEITVLTRLTLLHRSLWSYRRCC